MRRAYASGLAESSRVAANFRQGDVLYLTLMALRHRRGGGLEGPMLFFVYVFLAPLAVYIFN